ncbi:MAG: MnhB domain-containing protein [Campylobacterota bacterium]
MNNIFKLFLVTISFLLFLLLSYFLINIKPFENSLEKIVKEHMLNTQITHDITYILLDFRSLDTLLEVAVIFLALIGIKTVSPYFRYKPISFPLLITDTYVSTVFPIIVIVAFYILFSGAYQSGGAFQASAILAGGFIIIKITKPKYLAKVKELFLKVTYSLGLFYFILVGLFSLLNGNFLEYPKQLSYFFILSIETLLTISLSAILANYFINGVQRFK